MRTSVFLVGLSLLGVSCTTTTIAPPPTQAMTLTAPLPADTMKRIVADTEFSGVVALIENGDVIQWAAAGHENAALNTMNGLDTRFGLASVGKLFTAVAIHQLAESGDLSLDDVVGRFLPDYPNTDVRQSVTITQLLKMRSGLGDIFGKSCDDPAAIFETHADYLCLFENDELQFTPGTDFAYSNAGYILLGRIVEEASGDNFYDYVQKNIFDVAGMVNTTYRDTAGLRAGTAVAYVAEGFDGIPESADQIAGKRLVANLGAERGTSAGGGFSDAKDFAAFDKALRSEMLITNGSLARIFSQGFIDGTRGAGLAGGAPGRSTRYRLLPNGRSIVAFGNRDLPSAPDIVAMIEKEFAE